MEEIKKAASVSAKSNIGLFLLLCFGFLSCFAGGFILAKTLLPPSLEPNPSSSPTSSNTPLSSTMPLQAGKRYFDDTVIAITKSLPRKVLVATLSRNETNSQFVHNGRVSFFDGVTWKRKFSANTYVDFQIHPGNLIKLWETQIDKSRVLKEKTQGEIVVDNVSIKFDTGELSNEMSLRSLPGYTKLMSRGTGLLSIDGVIAPAYIMYSRIYSQDASQIQFYSEPFGLTTSWLILWDDQGNFYHIDMTHVDKPTSIYETHQVAIVETPHDQVTKTFDVISSIDLSVSPPENYTFNLRYPLNLTLSIHRLDALNKNEGGAYEWYMGNVEAVVTLADGEKVNGFGLIEYIHK